MADTAGEAPILLFDGNCNLCNGAVQFVLDHEAPSAVEGARLRFASLQSAAAMDRLRARGHALPAGDPETMVLIEDGRLFERSTAALRVARHLRAPWRFAYALIVVPAFVRDAVYRWIARNRYRWFGKSESCRVPTPELRARFLG